MIVSVQRGRGTVVLQPALNGRLTFSRDEIDLGEGRVVSRWLRIGRRFFIRIRIPSDVRCELRLPDGRAPLLERGEHRFECRL